MRNFGLSLVCSLLLISGGCGKDNAPPSLGGNNPSVKGPAPVAATGQDTCFNAKGTLIDCAATGQDGDLKKGVALPTPRFSDNSDGTVTDNLTGLMWMKEDDCIYHKYPAYDTDATPGDGQVDWTHSLNFAAAVNAGTYDCGVTTKYADWRLPNIKELESLFDFIEVNPQTMHSFTSRGYNLFSSTTVPEKAGSVIIIGTGDIPALGDAFAITRTSEREIIPLKKAAEGSVWLVRTATTTAVPAPVAATGQSSCYDGSGASVDCSTTSGQDGNLRTGVLLPTPRFTDNGDGTVTDNLTGLTWLTQMNCIGTLLPSLDNDASAGDGAVSWQHALDFVAGLNYGAQDCGQSSNYTDWRLPNIKELRSLTNQAYYQPAISNRNGDGKWSAGDPFIGYHSLAGQTLGVINPGFFYWSSTTQQSIGGSLELGNYTAGSQAMAMEFDYGLTAPFDKTAAKLVWPVRGGN